MLHQGQPTYLATATEDERLCIFDMKKKDLVRSCKVGFGLECVHISPVELPHGEGGRGSAYHIAVGGLGGKLKVMVRRPLPGAGARARLPSRHTAWPTRRWLHLVGPCVNLARPRSPFVPPQEDTTLQPIFHNRNFKTDILDVRYSPNGAPARAWLATALLRAPPPLPAGSQAGRSRPSDEWRHPTAPPPAARLAQGGSSPRLPGTSS